MAEGMDWYGRKLPVFTIVIIMYRMKSKGKLNE